MAKRLDGYLDERVEALYVSEDYKVFLMTGQTNGHSSRRGYVTIRPFNFFSEAELSILKIETKKLSPEARLNINIVEGRLSVFDGCTGVASYLPISDLDADVQERIMKQPSLPKPPHVPQPAYSVR